MDAEFLRQKAAQCREMADKVADTDLIERGLRAMALELDAQALAIEAGETTAREVETIIHPSPAEPVGTA